MRSSCSLLASKCFSPTRDSRTNRSAAKRVRQNERKAAVGTPLRRAQKQKPIARNAGKKPRCLSGQRKGGRFFAVNASSNGEPWARHRLEVRSSGLKVRSKARRGERFRWDGLVFPVPVLFPPPHCFRPLFFPFCFLRSFFHHVFHLPARDGAGRGPHSGALFKNGRRGKPRIAPELPACFCGRSRSECGVAGRKRCPARVRLPRFSRRPHKKKAHRARACSA